MTKNHPRKVSPGHKRLFKKIHGKESCTTMVLLGEIYNEKKQGFDKYYRCTCKDKLHILVLDVNDEVSLFAPSKPEHEKTILKALSFGTYQEYFKYRLDPNYKADTNLN